MANRLRPLALLLLVLAVCSGLTSCAAITTSRTSSVSFNSQPSGATVMDNGDSIGRTPCMVSLRSGIDHTIMIHKSGYKPFLGVIGSSGGVWPYVGDAFFAFYGFAFSLDPGKGPGVESALSFVPLVIDLVTLPHGTLDRQNVDVTLDKE